MRRRPSSKPFDLLKAPFVWFGGKRRVGGIVWHAFGDVPNYIEPFAGSIAVLLARSSPGKIETVNDLDGSIVNVWRAIQGNPAETAKWADWPVSEIDLHARHAWLIKELPKLRERLVADPDYFDTKMAGWWLWGIAQWIGSGWCRFDQKKMPIVTANRWSGDVGVRQLPSLSVTGGGSVQGIRRVPAVGHSGRGVHRPEREALEVWFTALAERLRRVRIISGDWARVLTPSITGVGNTLGNMGMSPCGVFLDPPYADEEDVYSERANGVAAKVREWAIANGDDPKLRIALCGYEGEHDMPDGWTAFAWKAAGGYGNQGKGKTKNVNARRERIYFSRHCLHVGVSKLASLEGIEVQRVA